MLKICQKHKHLIGLMPFNPHSNYSDILFILWTGKLRLKEMSTFFQVRYLATLRRQTILPVSKACGINHHELLPFKKLQLEEEYVSYIAGDFYNSQYRYKCQLLLRGQVSRFMSFNFQMKGAQRMNQVVLQTIPKLNSLYTQFSLSS